MKKILVVEDDADQRYLLAKMLRMRGHDVGEAESLAQALAIKAEYDLVVTDYRLGPTEVGTALAPGPPPVVVISGFGRPADYAGPWVLKPVAFEVLLPVLEPYLGPRD